MARTTLQTLDDFREEAADVVSRLAQLGVVDCRHGGHRVNSRDFSLTRSGFADHHVSGQHRSDLVLHLECPPGQMRIAGTEDRVGPEVDTQLVLHRRAHIDGRNDAETFRRQSLSDMRDRRVKRHVDRFADVVIHLLESRGTIFNVSDKTRIVGQAAGGLDL